jgi:hypothetical protein
VLHEVVGEQVVDRVEVAPPEDLVVEMLALLASISPGQGRAIKNDVVYSAQGSL